MPTITLTKRGTDPDPAYELGQPQHDGNLTTIEGAVNAHDASIVAIEGAHTTLAARVGATEVSIADLGTDMGALNTWTSAAIASKVDGDDIRLSNPRDIRDGDYGAFTASGGVVALKPEVVADAIVAAAANVALAPALGAALAQALQALDNPGLHALLLKLFKSVLLDGEIPRLGPDGDEVVGIHLEPTPQASQADVLAGTDTDKEVTAEAAGGFYVERTIAAASTQVADFSGATPVWGATNEVAVEGAVAFSIQTFPEYMDGREFTAKFIRVSGTGQITIPAAPSGLSSVIYRGGLSAADIPVLGSNPGDWVSVRGVMVDEDTWAVLAFDWYP